MCKHGIEKNQVEKKVQYLLFPSVNCFVRIYRKGFVAYV